MDEETKRANHEWVFDKRTRSTERSNQIGRVLWAVVTTLAIGTVTSFLGLLWWAFKVFVERGGQ